MRYSCGFYFVYFDNEAGYNEHVQPVNTHWTRVESDNICLHHKKEGTANMAIVNSEYKMQPSTSQAQNSR
jgi:hypothetical protein